DFEAGDDAAGNVLGVQTRYASLEAGREKQAVPVVHVHPRLDLARSPQRRIGWQHKRQDGPKFIKPLPSDLWSLPWSQRLARRREELAGDLPQQHSMRYRRKKVLSPLPLRRRRLIVRVYEDVR